MKTGFHAGLGQNALKTHLRATKCVSVEMKDVGRHNSSAMEYKMG